MKVVFPLLIICVVASVILSVAYNITGPSIAEQERKRESNAIFSVLPQTDSFDKIREGEAVYYKAYKGDRLVGFVLLTEGRGYGGAIKLMVGIEPDGKITGVRVLKQKETPGLGARIVEIGSDEKEPWFTRQFRGKRPAELNLRNIQAITGATISSKALIDAVKEEIEKHLHLRGVRR